MTEAYVNATPSIREPFGLVPLEAAASNTATVGSKVGGIKHTVVHEKTGLHSAPGSPSSIAQQLRRSLNDPEWNRWMSQNAAERAEQKFNWDTIAERTVKEYREVAN
jgi:Glycosyltransferase